MKPVLAMKPALDQAGAAEAAKTQEPPRRARVVAIIILAIALVGMTGGVIAAFTTLNNRTAIVERVLTLPSDGTNVSVRLTADARTSVAVLVDGNTTIVREYNKGFAVYAMPGQEGQVTCFIRLIDNATADFASVQNFIVKAEQVNADGQGTLSPQTVERVVGGKIRDTSFLSDYSQQACRGHDAYWVAPTESQASSPRTRRGSCCICLPGYWPLYRPRCFCYCPIYLPPIVPIPDPGPIKQINQVIQG